MDWSFVLEYMKYVNKFVRIFNFPFYFRGEVYDPFETLTLSEQNFDILFKDYVNSFYDAIKRATNPKVREFIVTKMGNKIANEFEPTRYDINERYQTHKDTLVELSKFLHVHLVKTKS